MTANVGGKYNHKPTFMYRAIDAEGSLLYVGITHDPDQRLKSHRYKAAWFADATRFIWRCYPNRRDAMDAERSAIDIERPTHNVTWTQIAEKRRANKRRLDAWRQQTRDRHQAGLDCGHSWCKTCQRDEPVAS